MKRLILIIGLLAPLFAFAQPSARPAYCDELPNTYDKTVPPRDALPRFNTAPVPEYKVQVALLKYSHPRDYPFHRKLIARYRPCEQVWVVESRESFRNRAEAERLKNELKGLGYTGAYIIELLGWE
ncbi:MAG: hypothetical protein KDD19_03515 [Phaeodactylibacter sp.]|nr:hypothetical protein [Phaeodactylibacter sp.]MCB9051395.1 hypothetical protein [Lewinellaceae bacterium]